jgi:hypothetical protein
MDILLGLLAIVVGLGLCFAGYRVFLILLPIWGLVAGFWVGSAGMQALFGEGFLATVTSWVVGIVVGLIFAVLSYLFWYVSIAVLGASVGASVGSGILSAIGIDSSFVLAIAALVVAVVFAAAVFLLNIPKWLVIAYTALAGAVVAIAGVLLLFNQFEVEQLGPGAAIAIVQESWFWLFVWAALAAVGLAAQILSTAGFEADLRRELAAT